MKYETLPKKVLFLWECCAIIICGILTLIVLLFLNPHTIVWYCLLWLIGAMAVLVTTLYLPLFYISSRYIVLEDRIVVKKGVIFNSTQFMNRENISFVTIFKNPFTKLLDLSTLMISAPGARITILLMSHRRALSIAKQLSHDHKFKE